MKQLIDRLRKAPWESRDAARRAEAVAQGDDATLIARLPDIARSDEAAEVRQAAVRRLRDLALLGDRMRNDRDASVRTAARERYRLALVDPALASLAERERVVAVEDDAEILAHVAGAAPEATLRRFAIERARKPALVIERCQRDPDPALRLWLLEQIDNDGVLERIAESARRTDKRLARAARERLLALRLAAGDPATLRTRALALCDELDTLRRTLPPDTDEQAQALEREWHALRERVAPELATRVDGFVRALAAARVPRGGTTAEPEAPAAAEPVLAEAVPAVPEPTPEPAPEERESDAQLHALIAELDALPAECEQRTLDRLRRRFDTRWREIARPREDESALRQRLDTALEERTRALRVTQERRGEDVERALLALEQAIERGELAAARAAQVALEAARAGTRLTPAQASRLGTAGEKLAQFDQWQHWSSNKVRTRLCTELEQLASAGLHPDALATRVREVQAEWTRIAQAELAPGQVATETGLDRRFRGLCHRALAPARAYFEKRGDLRTQRTTETEQFIAEATAALDAGIMDARALPGWRRRVGEALRRLDEVDPRQRTALGKRLRALMARCSESQAALVADAEAAKRKLLANLRRALAQASLDEAIEKSKEAQAAWQRLPRASRALEDTLAAELRELVDPWFKRQQEQRDAESQARNAGQQAARDVLSELAALAADGELLRQADNRIAAITARWREMHAAPAADRDAAHGRRDSRERSPRRDDRGGRDDRGARDARGRDRDAGRDPRAAGQRDADREFDRAVERVREAQRAAANARELQSLARRRAAAALCDEAERCAWDGADAGRIETLRERWATLAADAGDELAGRYERAREWLEDPQSSGQLDAAAADAAARGAELALIAELLAGVESPAEQRNERRALQMQRLAERMRGGALPEPGEEARAVLDEWLGLGPLVPAVREDLAARIERALSGFSLS